MKSFSKYIKEGGIYKEWEGIEITLDNAKDKKYKYTGLRNLAHRRLVVLYISSLDAWDIVILTGASNGVSIGTFYPYKEYFEPNTSTKYGKQIDAYVMKQLLNIGGDSAELAAHWDDIYKEFHPDVQTL